MDAISCTVHCHFALVYFENIVMFSQSTEAYIEHMRHVITQRQEAGVNSKPKKYEFFSNIMNYQGHTIPPRLLEVSQQMVDGIRDSKPPTNISEQLSFLGLCRRFRLCIQLHMYWSTADRHLPEAQQTDLEKIAEDELLSILLSKKI